MDPSPEPLPRTKQRVEQLYQAILENRCRSLIEIGVHRGNRARRFLRTAAKKRKSVVYHGFDLFGLFTEEVRRRESSPTPLTRAAVEAHLEELVQELAAREGDDRREIRYTLHEGFTHDTLPAFLRAEPDFRADFIFIDGGHSIETIASDWSYCSRMVRPGGLIFLDDYYESEEHTRRYGCNQLVASLQGDPGWEVTVLPIADPSPRGITNRIVRVERLRPSTETA
jgi:hypothetical protein